MYEFLNVFTNKTGNYHLLYELENEHHRHVTWLLIFLILIDRTIFLTYYYLLKLTTFNNVKCLIECTILNKIKLLLYSSAFKENLDDIYFHVKHSVQLLNWIHFRKKSLHMDIQNKKMFQLRQILHIEISIVHRIKQFFFKFQTNKYLLEYKEGQCAMPISV